jgi:hypothetical protein
LDKFDGKRVKIDVFNGNPGPLMKSPFKFRQYGKSGTWVCEKYVGRGCFSITVDCPRSSEARSYTAPSPALSRNAERGCR